MPYCIEVSFLNLWIRKEVLTKTKFEILFFNLVFIYEAMARASAVAGMKTDCENYIKLAKEAGEKIKSKEIETVFQSARNSSWV